MGSLFTKSEGPCAWSSSYIRRQITTCMQMGGVSHMVVNFNQMSRGDARTLIFIREQLRSNTTVIELVNAVWKTKAGDIQTLRNMLSSLQLIHSYLKYSWIQIVQHTQIFVIDLQTMTTFLKIDNEDFINYMLFKIATHHHMKKLTLDLHIPEVREAVVMWGLYMLMVVSDCDQLLAYGTNVTLDCSYYFGMFLADKEIKEETTTTTSSPSDQPTSLSEPPSPTPEHKPSAPLTQTPYTVKQTHFSDTEYVLSLDPRYAKCIELPWKSLPDLIGEDVAMQHISKSLNGFRSRDYHFNII